MRLAAGLKWGMIAGIGTVVLLMSQCNPEPRASNEKEELVYLNHSDTVDYVGIETCKGCHYSIYKTFIETGMGSSFGEADTAKSIAEISGHAVLTDHYSNLSYHPHWENSELYLSEFRLGDDDTIYKKEVKIDYVVGSGQHTNSHIYELNNYLFQAPFTWYSQKGKLDLPPGYEDGNNTRFSRLIGLECTSCHNSMPTGFVAGSINKYSKVPGAIDCERCHGPGELHVSRMLRGEFVDTTQQIDYSIVNPANLSIDLQFETCQRCHLQGNTVVAEGKTFFDFKPGMKLNAVMDIYLPRYSNSEDEFIMASHVDRFKQSACYLESGQQFNCMSCHNPHISVRATNIQIFNSACANCHKGAPTYACTEDPDILKMADFNCVNCHMPKSSSTDIPHVTVHDHKIDIPKKRIDTTGIKRFLGLVAVNNKNPTDRSKAVAYLQQFEKFGAKPYYLDSAHYFLEKLEHRDDHLSLWIKYFFLKKEFGNLRAFAEQEGLNKVLNTLTERSYNNDDAWTAYRIGEAYSGNDNAAALKFYKKAVDLAPFIGDFRNKYATTLVINGQENRGIDEYKKLLEELPNNKEALNNLGFAYLSSMNIILAEKYIDRALAEDPDYEKAWLNKASLYMLAKDKGAAKKALKEVLRINPASEKAKAALAYLNP